MAKICALLGVLLGMTLALLSGCSSPAPQVVIGDTVVEHIGVTTVVSDAKFFYH